MNVRGQIFCRVEGGLSELPALGHALERGVAFERP
jgi:hypothetical protein